MRVNEQVVERLEKVIDTLRDNSVKMGQMLAVHDEKLTKQDRIDAVLFEKVESVHREVIRSTKESRAGCEGETRKVVERIRKIERKKWTITGAISIISFVVSPIGQRIVGSALTPTPPTTIIQK